MLTSIAALGGVGTVGFAAVQSDRPKFLSAYTTFLDEPVVEGAPQPDSGPPYYATVLTSASDARKRLHPSVLGDAHVDDWTGVDYGDSFVAVFVSRIRVTPPGVGRGDLPLTEVTNGRVRFTVDQSSVDGGFDYREELFTRLELWQHDGAPPEEAVVRLE